MNTYTPQAGTIPAKVIKVLQDLEPGAEVSSAGLLDLIGQPHSWHGLGACMKMAVDAGVVRKRKVDLINFWSMAPARGQGQFSGVVRAEADLLALPVLDLKIIDPVPDSISAPRPSRAPAECEAPSAAEAEALAVRAISADAPQPAATDVAPPDTTGDEFECALTSANRLVMRLDGLDITLCPQRTRMLFRYLDRVRPPECEGTAA